MNLILYIFCETHLLVHLEVCMKKSTNSMYIHLKHPFNSDKKTFNSDKNVELIPRNNRLRESHENKQHKVWP